MRTKVFIAALAAMLVAGAFLWLWTNLAPSPQPACMPCAPCTDAPRAATARCLPPITTPVTPSCVPCDLCGDHYDTSNAYCLPAKTAPYPVVSTSAASAVSLPLPDGVQEIALPDATRQAILARHTTDPAARIVVATADIPAAALFADYGAQLTDVGWTTDVATQGSDHTLYIGSDHKAGAQLLVIAADVANWPYINDKFAPPQTAASDTLHTAITGKHTVLLVVKAATLY